MSTTAIHPVEDEVTILARVLGSDGGSMPADLARYLIDLGFSDRDKARMHDLALRNQDDTLSAAEKDELFAYGKAGDLLAILKSRARRTLGIKAERPTGS